MQDHFLESCGIAYRTNELRSDRQTLVFIHGLSGSCSAWYLFEKLFEDTHNVVTYDLRGHGLSKRCKKFDEYAIELFAADLQNLLDHLKIDTCVLISHSFGTLIALELMTKNAVRVTRNIFLSPNFHTRDYLLIRIIRPFVTIASLTFSLIPSIHTRGRRIDYTTIPKPSADWSLRRIIPEIHAMSLRLYLYCLRHIYAYEHDNLWATITVPTLVVHGERDSFVPLRYGIQVAHIISDAKLVILKGANHMLVLNNVPEVCEEIEKFIR